MILLFCTMPSCKIREAYYTFLGLSLCVQHYDRAMRFVDGCKNKRSITSMSLWEVLAEQDLTSPLVHFRRE